MKTSTKSSGHPCFHSPGSKQTICWDRLALIGMTGTFIGAPIGAMSAETSSIRPLLSPDDLRTLYPLRALCHSFLRQPHVRRVHVERESVYLGGSYCKLSRQVNHTLNPKP